MRLIRRYQCPFCHRHAVTARGIKHHLLRVDGSWQRPCSGGYASTSHTTRTGRPSIKERAHEFVVTNITPGRCGSCGEHVDDAPHVGRSADQ